MTFILLIVLAVIIIGAFIYFKSAGKGSVSGPETVSETKPVQPPTSTFATTPPEGESKPDRNNKNNPDSDSALSSGGQG